MNQGNNIIKYDEDQSVYIIWELVVVDILLIPHIIWVKILILF